MENALRVFRAVTRSPPYLSRPQVDQPPSRAPPPFDLPRLDFFRLTFLYPFLLQLASVQASSWTLFGDPNRPKIGPRRVFRRHFIENVDFHETLRFPMVFGVFSFKMVPQNDPRSLQDGSEIVLDRFFGLLFFRFDFGSFSVPFWCRFRCQNGSPGVGANRCSGPLGETKTVLGSAWFGSFFVLRFRFDFLVLLTSFWVIFGCPRVILECVLPVFSRSLDVFNRISKMLKTWFVDRKTA